MPLITQAVFIIRQQTNRVLQSPLFTGTVETSIWCHHVTVGKTNFRTKYK